MVLIDKNLGLCRPPLLLSASCLGEEGRHRRHIDMASDDLGKRSERGEKVGGHLFGNGTDVRFGWAL